MTRWRRSKDVVDGVVPLDENSSPLVEFTTFYDFLPPIDTLIVRLKYVRARVGRGYGSDQEFE